MHLRAPEPEDIDFLFKIENDTKNWVASNTCAPYSRYQIKRFIEDHQNVKEHGQCRLMIEEDGITKGCVDVFDYNHHHSYAYIGILMHENYRGNGSAKQALKLLDDYNHRYWQIKSLLAYVAENNINSLQLFLNSGYEEKGRLSNLVRSETGSFVDLFIYQKSFPF